MTIDWITVAAQFVNFFVLVLLLRRFLYRPILDGIDAREAEIANRLRAAEDAKATALEAATQHREALATLHAQTDSLRDAARASGEAEAQQLKAAARATLTEETTRWREMVANDRAGFIADVRATAAHAIVRLTRKALADLADASLEDQIATRLEAQLATLGAELAAKSAGAGNAVALSSFELSQSRQRSLAHAFRTYVADRELEFRTDPAAPPGLILQVGGARLGWSAEDYLDALESELKTLVHNFTERSEENT